jgi:hypothetical protein
MRKPIYLSMMMCLACAVISKKSFAQVARTDSSSQQNALNNTLTLFYSSIGDQSPLYNGPEYYFYDPLIKGNAYFADVNAFAPGSVFYDGLFFNGVPMLYDLYTDKVVVLLYNHFSKFSLIQERVKSFDFLNHHFININADTLNINSIIKSGFYDELYNGKSQVLVKRSKNIQTTTGGQAGPESYFNPSIDYYLRKSNTYYSFSSQGSMLSILKDKKKELQQYIRANQIKFRKDPEEAMVKIASYYDHLTN